MSNVLEPKGYINNENIDTEVMSKIMRAQIKRGLELELCIVDRLIGLIDGFAGFQLYWGKKHKTNNRIGYFDKNGKGLPKKTYKQLLIEGIFPDVDIVIIDQSYDVVFVVSSKGALSDVGVYATYAHGKEWNFPLFVVTKDEKRIFATGKTKYIALLRAAGVKVYISNHKDYDKPKIIMTFKAGKQACHLYPKYYSEPMGITNNTMYLLTNPECNG